MKHVSVFDRCFDVGVYGGGYAGLACAWPMSRTQVAGSSRSPASAYDSNTLQLDTETLPAAFYDDHELLRLYEDGTETHGLEGRPAGFDLQDGGQSILRPPQAAGLPS